MPDVRTPIGPSHFTVRGRVPMVTAQLSKCSSTTSLGTTYISYKRWVEMLSVSLQSVGSYLPMTELGVAGRFPVNRGPDMMLYCISKFQGLWF